MTSSKIITIDGPAGAGKSTVARQLAARLDFDFLDTGSMYRAVTLCGLRAGINFADANAAEKLLPLAHEAKIDVRSGKTWLQGEDVTDAVRASEVAAQIRVAADSSEIRGLMVAAQRRIAAQSNAENRGVVTEGRDQGNEVFFDAPCKFFLTASGEERAQRRQGELIARGATGDEINLEKILRAIQERDSRDENRAVGALRAAPDAIEILTDGMSINEVVEQLEKLAREKLQ